MQLQLDIYSSHSEFSFLQQQIDAQSEQIRKMRKKLFAEISSLKKTQHDLNQENKILKNKLYEYTSQKTDWIYGQNDYLFDVQANQG